MFKAQIHHQIILFQDPLRSKERAHSELQIKPRSKLWVKYSLRYCLRNIVGMRGYLSHLQSFAKRLSHRKNWRSEPPPSSTEIYLTGDAIIKVEFGVSPNTHQWFYVWPHIFWCASTVMAGWILDLALAYFSCSGVLHVKCRLLP